MEVKKYKISKSENIFRNMEDRLEKIAQNETKRAKIGRYNRGEMIEMETKEST